MMIISGGQTGADRAALDAAIELNIPYGGWCPKGRIDEKGIIPEKYRNLTPISGEFQTEQENYDTRTKPNIRDSDGTLILVPELPLPPKIKDGTLLTIKEVERQNKPHLTIDLSESMEKKINAIVSWVEKHHIQILNVAGPRETSSPGIYQDSLALVTNALPYFNHALRACL